jgi:hypothetical protein
MERFFVRISPGFSGASQFFVVWAGNQLEAARLALAESNLGPGDFDPNDCIALSQQWIPIPGETPPDLRHVPIASVMFVPSARRHRQIA